MPGSSLRQFLVRFAIALVLVSVAGGVGIAAGNRRFADEVHSIPTVEIDEEAFAPEERGEPANFLVIGSDSRAFVENEGQEQAFGSADEVGGQRSDTMMVVHVDPDTRTGFVVSFPRDLWVQIPGHGEARLNTAFARGGPQLVIETLAANYDVPIHHYLEVDFAGFEDIVNTIGGVDIYFPTPARDAYSGLNIETAGCHELDGAQSLAYARSRHFEYYDAESGRWRMDPRSDLSRIERQQYFLRSLADTAVRRGARNPKTAFDLLDDVAGSLQRDVELGLDDMKGLINAFRDRDPASLEMMTLPTVGVRHGGADVLEPKVPDAEPILARLRSFGLPTAPLPELPEPAETSVIVRNGAGRKGLAGEVLDALVAHGFQAAAPAEDAERDDYPLTHVRYAPGAVGAGLLVASYLGTADVAEARVPDEHGADVVVVVGGDWDDLVAPVREPPVATTTTAAGDDAATSTSVAPTITTTTSTTTTTRPRTAAEIATVPVDPETGGPLVGCP